jgi:hypothetical protein
LNIREVWVANRKLLKDLDQRRKETPTGYISIADIFLNKVTQLFKSLFDFISISFSFFFLILTLFSFSLFFFHFQAQTLVQPYAVYCCGHNLSLDNVERLKRKNKAFADFVVVT